MSIRPLMLGIVGDSGSGKTTLSRGLARRLGQQGVTPLCLDDYHRYERAVRSARNISALDPAANDLGLVRDHLATLRSGGTIRKPVYDHRTGTLRGPETVAATGLVIAYGMLTLATPDLARLFDLTVYLDPDQELARRWRLERNVAQRGYTRDEVLLTQPAHERDAQRFVLVQRVLADMVLRFYPSPRGPLGLRVVLRRPMLAELGSLGAQVREDEDGRLAHIVDLPPGEVSGPARSLRAELSRLLPEARPSAVEGSAGGAALALAQDLVAACLLRAREEADRG